MFNKSTNKTEEQIIEAFYRRISGSRRVIQLALQNLEISTVDVILNEQGAPPSLLLQLCKEEVSRINTEITNRLIDQIPEDESRWR